MVRVVSIITAILLFGLSAYLVNGENVPIVELEIHPQEQKTNVYQCEHYGIGPFQDYHRHCILGVLEISGRQRTILCCR